MNIATLNISEGNQHKINVNSSISFAPFVRFLKEKAGKVNKVKASVYKIIIEKFEAHPELMEPFTELAILDKYIDLVHMLDIVVAPMVNDDNESLIALGFPFDGRLFHYPETFANRFINDEDGFIPLPSNKPIEQLYNERLTYVYKNILRKFFQVEVSIPDYMVFSMPDNQSGLTRYYKAYMDNRFADIKYIGDKLPDVTNCVVCEENNSNIPQIEKLMQVLPLEDFEMEGFTVIKVEDFTVEECLTEMKNIILNMPNLSVNDSYSAIENIVQTLVGVKLFSINFFPFIKVNEKFIKAEECDFNEGTHNASSSTYGHTFYDFSSDIESYIENPETVLLPVYDKKAVISNYPMLKSLVNSGVGSYLLHPVYYQDKMMGIIEIASDKPDVINYQTVLKLQTVIPLIAQVFNIQVEKFEEKIDKLIKEQFTALQPSVEWKFNEIAWQYFKNKNQSNRQIGNVVFENVYPLYGAVDIRNSSIERNIAIQKDFVEQLFIIGETIGQLKQKIGLPLLDGLHFKNDNLLKNTREKLSPEDEIKLDYYFEDDVEPLFRHLYETNPQAKPILDVYFNAIDTTHGHVYRYRKEYEESLDAINNAVNSYLSLEKEKTQESYPNYFEKYKTDGVEYNIYIGQTLAPTKPFNLIYLKNLRLWQLTSMVELARLTNKILPGLEVPLHTTQLILVHNTPIDISFRKDEKRFDTEGAYNLRYEIMKKRIDKSHIKNTNERLTQPDKIAIVYSSTKDAEEYMSYISFLQNKGALLPEIEQLELEELQGVYGLKALRVGVNYINELPEN